MINIGIDIDDTITDTFDFLMKYVSEYFNIDINYLKENNISYSNLPIEYKKDEKEFGMKTFSKILNEVPIKKDASKVIKELKEKGFNIYIITARDETIFKTPYEDTMNQLKNLDVYYNKLICTFDKKEACIQNNIDLFIDDSISNLDTVSELGIDTLLFESKVNKDTITKHDKVSNWNELYNYIINKYNNYNRTH